MGKMENFGPITLHDEIQMTEKIFPIKTGYWIWWIYLQTGAPLSQNNFDHFTPDALIDKYKILIKDLDTNPNDVADLFLAVVKSSLENMGPYPETAEKLLHSLTESSIELFQHFKSKDALSILQEKVKHLQVKEYPE